MKENIDKLKEIYNTYTSKMQDFNIRRINLLDELEYLDCKKSLLKNKIYHYEQLIVKNSKDINEYSLGLNYSDKTYDTFFCKEDTFRIIHDNTKEQGILINEIVNIYKIFKINTYPHAVKKHIEILLFEKRIKKADNFKRKYIRYLPS